MIAVIGAMDIEVTTLTSLLSDVSVKEISSRTFYQGKLDEKDVVVVKAGIGKVNSAVTTAILCENFDVEYVINTGVAGGYKVKEKSLVISTKAIYFDANAIGFGYEMGQIPGENKFFIADTTLVQNAEEAAKELELDYTLGVISTGDSFVTEYKQIEAILKETEEIRATEMEGASIAQTAQIYNVPFLIVRAISDVIGSDGQLGNYEEFVAEAADNAANLVERIIKRSIVR